MNVYKVYKFFEVKDLRKIIAFFLFIFVAGTAVTFISINKKLKKNTPIETVKVSKDTIEYYTRYKRAV